MINDLLELHHDDQYLTRYQSDTATTKTVEINKKTNLIEVIETPGLGALDSYIIKNMIYDLSKQTRPDILLYCASLMPTSRFDATDVEIIQSFTNTYGSEIWEHTILVLTFANTRKYKSEDEYKQLIEYCAETFQKVLHLANVKNVQVQSIFSKNGGTRVDTVVPAIPVGELSLEEDLIYGQNWSDLLLQEILTHCDHSVAIQLLKWKGILPSEPTYAVEMIGAAIGASIGLAMPVELVPAGMKVEKSVTAASESRVGGNLLEKFDILVSWIRSKLKQDRS